MVQGHVDHGLSHRKFCEKLTTPFPALSGAPRQAPVQRNPVDLISALFGKFLRKLGKPGTGLSTTTAGRALFEETPGEIGENGYFAQFGFHNR